MAAAIAGAVIGGVADVIGSGIKAGTENTINKRNIENQQLIQQRDLDYKLRSLQLEQEQQTKIQNLTSSTQYGLQSSQITYDKWADQLKSQTTFGTTQLQTEAQKQVAQIQNQGRNQLQQKEYDQATYLRNNLQASLEKAGLPSYLAYIQPDSSMLETRQIRGVNYYQAYKGQADLMEQRSGITG